MWPAKRNFFLIAWLILLLLVPSAKAQEIRYFYDELGRLIGVVDEQGNAAEYVYDEVGNILEIRRTNVGDFPGPVAITFFNPDEGGVGTEVEISGAGFSDTPTENAVTFNGVAATVSAASTNSLTAAVPAGATTGPIGVTTPLGSAISQQDFTLLQPFVVVPDEADVGSAGSLGFQATLDGTPTSAVTWRVNGTVGGTAEFGTITPEGIYTAPASPPSVQPIFIEAVLTADPTRLATAIVQVLELGGLIAAFPVTVGTVEATGAQVVSGPVTIVTTSAQGAQRISGPLTVTRLPAVTSVTPASASVGTTGLGVTVNGENFQGASAIQFLFNGLSDPDLTASAVSPAPDGTSVTFNLSISATAPVGPRVLTVVTPQGTSTNFDIETNIFTVNP